MGYNAKYYGEMSSSTHERGLQDISDADRKLTRSHIYQQIKVAHPNLKLHDIPNQFRFKVTAQHKGAFYRQISEAVIMNNSKAIILNLKDEYSRCIVPDFKLGERWWREEGQQRECTKTVERPRERVRNVYIQKKRH